MGSKVSSEKNEKLHFNNFKFENENVESRLNPLDNDNLNYFYNNSSSYRGMKSDLSSQSIAERKKSETGERSVSEEVNSSNLNLQKPKNNLNSIENSSPNPAVIKASVTLYYKEGGGVVYLTGSFSNWSQWFLMKKSENMSSEFEITLELPLEVHYFKFIVDNVWKCSKDYPQINDGRGNINNTIDIKHLVINVINQNIPLQNDNGKNNENIDLKLQIENSNTNTTKTQTDSVEKKSAENPNLLKDYSNLIPKKSDLNCDAPLIPGNYKKPFDIVTQSLQKTLGISEYIITKNVREFTNNHTENRSCKTIATPPHVNLNLVYTNVQLKKRNKNNNVINISTTARFRNKFTTMVYYKPSY